MVLSYLFPIAKGELRGGASSLTVDKFALSLNIIKPNLYKYGFLLNSNDEIVLVVPLLPVPIIHTLSRRHV